MKEDTTDIKLPGEGDTKTIIRRRRQCYICGDLADFKHTYLLENARNNPRSNAYGRDDCSWSEDDHIFVCREHKEHRPIRQGCLKWCSTFEASERFAHMFLYWAYDGTEREAAL